MERCYSCGKPVSAQATFCPHCGNKLLIDLDPWTLLQRLRRAGISSEEALAIARSQAQRFRTFRRVLERLVEDCDKATMSSEALDTARTFLAEHCTQCGARRSEYLAETSLCMGCYDNPGGIVL